MTWTLDGTFLIWREEVETSPCHSATSVKVPPWRQGTGNSQRHPLIGRGGVVGYRLLVQLRLPILSCVPVVELPLRSFYPRFR